jgi:hypothetical protein
MYDLLLISFYEQLKSFVCDVSKDRSPFEIFRNIQQMTACHNLEHKISNNTIVRRCIPQDFHVNQTGPFADKA